MNPTQNEGGGEEDGERGRRRGKRYEALGDGKERSMCGGGRKEERITEENEEARILLHLFDDLTFTIT
jgi:hypothetical protein